MRRTVRSPDDDHHAFEHIRAARCVLWSPITMNKNTKAPKHKLALNHETIRPLTNDQLGKIAGGDYFSKISVCIFNPCTRQ